MGGIGMASAWKIAFALSVLSNGTLFAQEVPVPALWSGASDLEPIPGSAMSKLGEVKAGDVLAKVNKRPVRTARLMADYHFRAENWNLLIPAGTPLYAARFVIIQQAGSAPSPQRRADDVHWCVAAKVPPLVCFRWSGPDNVEIAGVLGDMMFGRTPNSWYFRAPEPLLKEQPVTFDEPYEETQTLKTIADAGVVVTQRYRQGAGGWSYDSTIKWDESTWRSSGGNMRLQPVRDAAGAVTGALVANAPP